MSGRFVFNRENCKRSDPCRRAQRRAGVGRDVCLSAGLYLVTAVEESVRWSDARRGSHYLTCGAAGQGFDASVEAEAVSFPTTV